MKISAMMKAHPKTVSSNDSITEAAKIMKTADVGSIPVVDNDKLVGIVTDRDIVLRTIANGKNYNECKVKDVMSKEIKACNEEDDTASALHLLGKCKLHRLPVINKSNKLVGIVSLSDFTKSEKDKTLIAETFQEIVSG